MPEPLFIGAIYIPPDGSPWQHERQSLLEELEERVGTYQQLGAVVVLGDCNMHIGDTPSVIALRPFTMLVAEEQSGPVSQSVESAPNCDDDELILHRSTVDAAASRNGLRFLERLNAVDVVVLNGLAAVGDGRCAEATHGEHSVIDLVLVDAAHWRQMEQVMIETNDARVLVQTDHELVMTAFQFQSLPIGARPSALHSPTAATAATTPRYRLNGPHDAVVAYEAACQDALAPLAAVWKEELDAGAKVNVEEAWSAFHLRVHSAAKQAFGERRVPSGIKRRDRDGALDRCVRMWIQQKRKLWERIRQLGPGSVQDTQRLQLRRQIREIDKHRSHYVRSKQHQRQNREMQQVAALRHCRPREHWAALRRAGNLNQERAPVPPTALDPHGVEHTDPAAVRAVWKKAWASLARQASIDDPRYDAETFVSTTLRSAEEHIEAEEELPLTAAQRVAAAALNSEIELDEVIASVKRLHRGKAVGCDGIAAEILKDGGDAMFQCLHQLIRVVWHGGDVPMAWLRGVIVPLHKDGDRRLPLNYRPITLLSIAGKVYTGVLLARLTSWTECHGIIVQEQGGFRPKRGCAEQVFALTELIKLRRMADLDTFACFIDIKKAYDTVWHDGLKAKLRRYGLHGRMFAAIASLYSAGESSLRLGAQLGEVDPFPVETGVRQGCVLSPILYSLFINDLALELKRAEALGIGLPLGNCRLCVLLYADDIVLLAQSEEEVSELMRIVGVYARQWRFEVNHAKCGLMCFHPAGDALLVSALCIGGVPVRWVSAYKYLGVELHNGKPFRLFRLRILQSATRASHAVSGMGMYSGKLPVPLGDQVYCAMVRPILEYCAEVWSTSPFEDAELLQTRMAKRILKCAIRTSSEAVRGELGWMKLEARYQQARVCFWGKIQRMDLTAPARMVYKVSQSHASSHREPLDARRVDLPLSEGSPVIFRKALPGAHGLVEWAAQMEIDLRQLDLGEYWRNPAMINALTEIQWQQKVKAAVQSREQHRWWKAITDGAQRAHLQAVYVPLVRREVFSPDGTLLLRRAEYLSMAHGGWNDRTLAGRRAMTALRCASSTLRCHVGGWGASGVPLVERFCNLCGMEVETEQHFLLRCQQHTESRANVYESIDMLVRQFIPAFRMALLNDNERVSVLLGCADYSLLPLRGQPRLQLLARCSLALAEWTLQRDQGLDHIALLLADE